MTIRKLESRIPDTFGFSINDLGQVSFDDRGPVSNGIGSSYYLVSTLTSPIRTNTFVKYYVFIPDAEVEKYKWTICYPNNESFNHIKTETLIGEFFLRTPNVEGTLDIKVEFTINNYNFVISMQQTIIKPTNIEIKESSFFNKVASIKGNPQASDKLVYDYRNYIFSSSNETGVHGIPPYILAAFCYSSMISNNIEFNINAMLSNPDQVVSLEELLKCPFNDKSILLPGIKVGVCQIKPLIAHRILESKEFKAFNDKKEWVEAETDYKTKVKEDTRIDILNILRFPKSNIKLCSILLKRIKNRNSRWPEIEKDNFLSTIIHIPKKREEIVTVIARELYSGLTKIKIDKFKSNNVSKSICKILSTFVSFHYFSSVPYGGYHLKEEDNDSLKKWGGNILSGLAGEYVKELQKDLLKLGYWVSVPLQDHGMKLNGEFTAILKGSVWLFQREHGINRTGVVSLITALRIKEIVGNLCENEEYKRPVIFNPIVKYYSKKYQLHQLPPSRNYEQTFDYAVYDKKKKIWIGKYLYATTGYLKRRWGMKELIEIIHNTAMEWAKNNNTISIGPIDGDDGKSYHKSGGICADINSDICCNITKDLFNKEKSKNLAKLFIDNGIKFILFNCRYVAKELKKEYGSWKVAALSKKDAWAHHHHFHLQTSGSSQKDRPDYYCCKWFVVENVTDKDGKVVQHKLDIKETDDKGVVKKTKQHPIGNKKKLVIHGACHLYKKGNEKKLEKCTSHKKFASMTYKVSYKVKEMGKAIPKEITFNYKVEPK